MKNGIIALIAGVMNYYYYNRLLPWLIPITRTRAQVLAKVFMFGMTQMPLFSSLVYLQNSISKKKGEPPMTFDEFLNKSKYRFAISLFFHYIFFAFLPI